MTGSVPAAMCTPDITVLTSGHDVADARLHRLVAALLRRDLRVEVLGLGEPEQAPDGVSTRTWVRPARIGRIRLALELPLRARGRVIVALDPDSLLGSSVIGRLRGRPVVADVHENYRRLLIDRRWSHGSVGAVARSLAAWAEWVAARRPLTLVADDQLPPHRARHRLVLRNLPDPTLVPPPREPDENPRAVYVGDVRSSRGLFAMLDAIKAAPGWCLDVVGPLAEDDADRLEARLSGDSALTDRVRWHGRLPPAQAWRVASGAWVGMCLLAPTPAFLEALPSKLYEYVFAGIIPVVSDLPRQRQFVAEAGAGYVVRDAEEAAAVLRSLSGNRADVVAARELLLESHQRAVGVEEYDAAASAIQDLLR